MVTEQDYKDLQKRFEIVSNELLSLQSFITSVIGTYKFYSETTKLEIPFPYKVVEDTSFTDSYNNFKDKE